MSPILNLPSAATSGGRLADLKKKVINQLPLMIMLLWIWVYDYASRVGFGMVLNVTCIKMELLQSGQRRKGKKSCY